MAKTKTITYTDTEKSIINALVGVDQPLTLAEISARVGHPLSSGNINALVTTKGNIAKGDDRVTKCPCCGAKRTVKTYYLVKGLDGTPVDAPTPLEQLAEEDNA